MCVTFCRDELESQKGTNLGVIVMFSFGYLISTTIILDAEVISGSKTLLALITYLSCNF